MLLKKKLNSYRKDKLREERQRLLRLLDIEDDNYNFICATIHDIEEALDIPLTPFILKKGI